MRNAPPVYAAISGLLGLGVISRLSFQPAASSRPELSQEHVSSATIRTKAISHFLLRPRTRVGEFIAGGT